MFRKQSIIKLYSRFKWIIFLSLLDQAVKEYLIDYLKNLPGMYFKISDYLDIVYSWNYGISFGILQEYHQYSNISFILLNSLIVIYLLIVAIKSNSIVRSISYNLIIGGAIGNIMDRIFRGAVFDYVYLHYHQYGFAVFNLADSYITLGAILMIYDCYILQKNIEINDKKNYNAHAPK